MQLRIFSYFFVFFDTFLAKIAFSLKSDFEIIVKSS